MKSQKINQPRIVKLWKTEQLSDDRIAKLCDVFTRVRQVVIYSENPIVSIVLNSVVMPTEIARAEKLGFKAELIGVYKGNVSIDFSFKVETE